MKKLLLLFLTSGLCGMTVAQTGSSGLSRGANEEAGFEAAQRSVENQLIVEEIEDAGFEIDVVEGFDEEWEEDIWVESEADDLDANHTDPTETAKFDLGDVPQPEEIAVGWSEDAWENPELVVEEHEKAIASEDDGDHDFGAMRGEEEASDVDHEILTETESVIDEDIAWDEETEDIETNWWEEESTDNWASVIDDLEIEEFDASLEEEDDLDLLEEMYFTN